MARQLPELLAHIEQHYGFSTRLFDIENREEIYRSWSLSRRAICWSMPCCALPTDPGGDAM